jgi:hypothetical protein
VLHRKPDTSGAFWQRWNRLHAPEAVAGEHGGFVMRRDD